VKRGNDKAGATKRIKKYGFVENQDYVTFNKFVKRGFHSAQF